jgi:hypothetical protein
MNDNKGGPAFPCDRIGAGEIVSSAGMSMRDYFAAKAMQGYVLNDALVKDTDTQQEWIDLTAKVSYQMADAMLKAREA